MKTIRTIGAVFAVLALVACQLPQGNTGSLKISLPASSSSKSVAVATTDKGDTVRLQLVRNGTTVPLGGESILEKSLGGQTITLDGLPTGTDYHLYASTGTWTSDKTFFQATYYQVSDAFEISAGSETAVKIVLTTAPVVLLAYGAGPNTSLAVGSTLYETDDSRYRVWTSTATPAFETTLSLGTRTLHSLGQSSTGVYLNTNAGLGLGTTTGYTFPTLLNADGTDITSSVNATKSGSFATTSGGTTYTLDVYAGAGLTAGVKIVGGTGNQNWYDLQTMLNLDTLEDSNPLKSSLKKTDGLILDFAYTSGYAYLATALATYRVDGSLLVGGTSDLGDKFVNGDDDVVIKATYNGSTQAIRSISTAYTDASKTSGYAFGGAIRGLFSGTVDSAGHGASDLSLVSGTLGLDIAALASVQFNGTVYTAAYAQNTGEVLILTGLNTVVARYPVIAGFPSGDLALSWWTPGSELYLVATGTNGTVRLKI